MIREGLKTDKILGTPNECIKKAADNGFTPAMWHMLSHEEQVGNYNAVYNIAKMLYIQGDVNAIKYLADCYFYGIGVKRDKRLAKDFYREAAKKGNKDAQDFLEKW